MTATRHFLLAAGGTGGHMLPAYALAGELIARGHRVALVSDDRGLKIPGAPVELETHVLPAGRVSGGPVGWIKAAHMQTVSQFAKHVKQQFFENVLVVLEPDVVVIDRKETKEGVEPAVKAIEMTAKHGTAAAAKAVREHLGIGAAPRDTAKQPSPVTTTKPTNDGQTPVTGSGKGADLAKAACALTPMDWLDFVKHMEAGGWHIAKASAKASKASKAKKPAKQAPVPTSAEQLGATA